MRDSASWVLACVFAAGLGACASGSAKADDSVSLLMTGDGAGTSFKAQGRNSKGARFAYEACHHPDGRIVARLDFGAGKVHQGAGLWSAEEERICVDWSTEGLHDICVSVARRQSGYEMMNVANGKKALEQGAFENGYLSWCADHF